MKPPALVRRIRSEAKLSFRALAAAAGVATTTVHRIEQGEIDPRVGTLERIAQAAGTRLHIESEVDYAGSIVGLALSIRSAIAEGDKTRPVRMAAELVKRYGTGDAPTRSRMISAEPPTTGDDQWDAFVAALAEWLAVQAGDPAPPWAYHKDRFLERGWWVTPMESMRAWEYAGSPASFRIRGVYLHRDSLTNV